MPEFTTKEWLPRTVTTLYLSTLPQKGRMFTLNCRGRLLVATRPLIMGIINVTPDSFFAGSRTVGYDILRQTEKMLADGADIIDVGAQSTRPRADYLLPDEELDRLSGVFAGLSHRFPKAFFSVDTFHSRVAIESVLAGAALVNDISGGTLDAQMIPAVASLRVPYVCMHMKGNAQTMASEARYENVVTEVFDQLLRSVEACRVAGIHDVIIDPGFGFAKTSAHNFHLLRELRTFQLLRRPVMAGLSRKSTIYKTLGVSPEEALNGTTALNMIALMNGANILRVHDVKAARECVTLFEAYRTIS